MKTHAMSLLAVAAELIRPALAGGGIGLEEASGIFKTIEGNKAIAADQDAQSPAAEKIGKMAG